MSSEIKTNTLQIGAHSIRRDVDMWCLTDMWRAAGAPKEKRPVSYERTAECSSFKEFLALSSEVSNSHLWKSRKIQSGGETWAHWQLALAYAKWLDHAFHARVNEIYRAFTSGQLQPRNDEAVRLALRIQRLDAADYESLWEDDLHAELARLRKVKGWQRGQASMPMAYAYGFVWRMMLGESVYAALKVRNPDPKSGTLHGQWISEGRSDLTKREDLVISLVFARRASCWSDFEADMRSHFRRTPIQLGLASVRRFGVTA
jgi:hypothetical protein